MALAAKRSTKGQVKVFSRTVEPGPVGAIQRITALARRRPIEIAGALTRRALRRGDPFRLLPFPQAVHIEITNHCNLKCLMCPHTTMEREKGFMDESLFRSIIDELAGHKLLLENVALMGLGEPLLHKDFERFAKIAADSGIPNLYASTNAALLSEERSRRIIEDGSLNRLIISLDGASKETFEKIRVGANFDRIEENVMRFLDLKRKLGKKRPQATLQILSMPETENEVDEFCRIWLPRLCREDEILIKEVDTFGGLVDDRRPNTEVEPEKRYACRQLWKDFSISWDGRATVCCKDVFYKLSVGRVGDSSISTLWTSKKWGSIRRIHELGQWGSLKPCDDCREWYV
jgi:wyosine [tRNA(Phe)-imidazoG37] synthetase (radical SAM superfamily)